MVRRDDYRKHSTQHEEYLEILKLLEIEANKSPILTRRPNSDESGIYFIQSVLGGPIKVGLTTKIFKRIISLQSACPFELRVIGFHNCHDELLHELEASFHQEFRAHRLHGEWFEPSDCILDRVKKYQNETVENANLVLTSYIQSRWGEDIDDA